MKEFLFDKMKLVNYIACRHISQKRENISPIKIQKALYFLFAFWGGWIRSTKNSNVNDKTEDDFGNFHDFLFKPNFYAWKYGPVDVEVYEWYKKTGGEVEYINPIELKNCIADEIDNKELKVASDYVNDYLEKIFNTGDFTLVELSHKDKCWQSARNEDDTPDNNEISGDEIIDEYVHKQQ